MKILITASRGYTDEDCDHKYTPNYGNLFGSPSCEKCGKLIPIEQQE